jgi:hypothetical protein
MVKNSTFSSTLESRLAAYGAMSLTLAAVSLPSTAQAGPITYNAGISTTQELPAVYFDIASGGFGNTAHTGWFELFTDVEDLITKARLGVTAGNQMFAVSASSVARLAPGTTVGPSLTFAQAYSTLASNTATPFGHWNGDGTPAEVGLSILLGGNTYYGWAEIAVDPVTYSITLNSFGRNDTPSESVVAPSPEPASIVLLCLGAAGIAAYRRKHNQA